MEVEERSSSATLEQVNMEVRRLYLEHAVEERSSSATLEQVEVVVRRLYQGHAVEERSSSPPWSRWRWLKLWTKLKWKTMKL